MTGTINLPIITIRPAFLRIEFIISSETFLNLVNSEARNTGPISLKFLENKFCYLISIKIKIDPLLGKKTL